MCFLKSGKGRTLPPQDLRMKRSPRWRSRSSSSSASEPCPDAAQQRWNWSGRPKYIAVWFVHGFLRVRAFSILYKTSVFCTSVSARLPPALRTLQSWRVSLLPHPWWHQPFCPLNSRVSSATRLATPTKWTLALWKFRASPTWKIFHKSILTSYIEFNFEYKLTALNHREFNTFYKKLKLTQFRLLMLFKLIKYQKHC